MDLVTYAVLNKKIDSVGNVPDEKITAAVNTYLNENPVAPGATAEQAAQIDKNVADIGKLKGDLDLKVPNTDYAPEEKNDAMTQPVGKDANGKLWTAPVSGGNVDFKTNETLTLKDGILSVNTTDQMVQDNTLPITSAGVYTIVGNIEVLVKNI